ncbi:MAG: bifunctional precorrin-2 dehydrogenase/sirohydrochlorin ferrochelatase [Lachnospiraceae bacterium]
MAYFPFMIEIGDKNCLVVGGGNIALHKVQILSGFGVAIKVVGTEICRELKELGNQNVHPQNQIDIRERAFQDNDVEGMDFVVAATDDEALNLHVSDLCKQKNILVNAVDMKDACSFIFPAMIQEKDLLIAISSGGQSPAAAAYVKRQIRRQIPDYYGDMVETLGEYRDFVIEHVDTARKRKKVFNRLLEYGDIHGGEISKDVVEHIVKEVESDS